MHVHGVSAYSVYRLQGITIRDRVMTELYKVSRTVYSRVSCQGVAMCCECDAADSRSRRQPHHL